MPNDLNKNSTTHVTVTLCKKRKVKTDENEQIRIMYINIFRK